MPRIARVVIDGGIYHVLTRGNNGRPVFQQEDDYRSYGQLLLAQVQLHQVRVYHFALMTNQVHLVMQVPVAAALSKVMSSVNLSYSWLYRKRYRYSGHLWQERFKSLLIGPGRSLLECGRHVELAPVRAGIVGHPEQHAWSSYHAYAKGLVVAVLAPHPIYPAIGSTAEARQQRYRQFIEDGLKPVASRDYFGVSLPRSPGRPRKLEALLSRRHV